MHNHFLWKIIDYIIEWDRLDLENQSLSRWGLYSLCIYFLSSIEPTTECCGNLLSSPQRAGCHLTLPFVDSQILLSFDIFMPKFHSIFFSYFTSNSTFIEGTPWTG